jgi:hypothetical protein
MFPAGFNENSKDVIMLTRNKRLRYEQIILKKSPPENILIHLKCFPD